MTKEAIISNWIKQGDLKEKKNYESSTLLIAQVEYINTNNNLNVKSFVIRLYKNSKTDIFVYFHSKEIAYQFQDIFPKEIADQTFILPDSKLSNLYRCCLSRDGEDVDSKDVLTKFLLSIHKNFPLDEIIKKDLESALVIKFPSDINEVLDAFKNTNNSADEKFKNALSLAEKLKDPETLWLLGKYCEETLHDLNKAVEAYKRIPNNDIYYCEARFKMGQCFEINYDSQKAFDCYQEILAVKPDHVEAHAHLANLYNFFLAQNAITPSLNKEEVEEYEKNQLFHWLKSASNDSQYQQRCDYYFHALCKGTDFFPATKNIKTDVDTLYALAKQVAQSKEEISNLKKQLSFMEEHSRFLEARVNSLTAENTNLKEQVDNFKLSRSLSLNTASSFFFNRSDPNNWPGNVYKSVKTTEKNALKYIKKELLKIKEEQFVNQCLRSMR